MNNVFTPTFPSHSLTAVGAESAVRRQDVKMGVKIGEVRRPPHFREPRRSPRQGGGTPV